MLLCKQIHCLWHLVYIECSHVRKRRRAAHQKGDDHVQDCRYRFRTFHRPVQPPHSLDRPPVDDQRPRVGSQRGPSLFRSLRPVDTRFLALQLSAQTTTRINTLDEWPHLLGPFFVSCGVNSLDISRTSAIYCAGRRRWRLIACALAYHIPKCGAGNAHDLNRSVPREEL
jgi:hypothetical protein